MKFLVDENIPFMTVQALRDQGNDVRDIRGSDLQGIEDDKLWKLAQLEHRILLTTDKGFSRFRTESHHGMLIVLLAQPSRRAIHERIILVLKQQPADSWPGLLIVVRDRVKSVFRNKNH